MAAYYHGGAGTDIQSGTDGLQTLYLMNPSYAGYGDAAVAEAGAPASAANMMFLNSAVTSMTPASFGHHHQQHHQPQSSASSQQQQQQHFVGIPLQAPPSGYNLWTTTTTTGAADMSSPPPQHAHGAAGVSAVLSLSSRETPPVTVAAVGAGDVTATPQGQMVMSSKYLRAAQQLLDEVVSVSNGVADDASKASAAAAKGAASVKKKEDSEGVSGGGTDDGGAAKSGGAAAPELSTAERQELQMKKGKLVNMLDEVEQRYRQYHQQMQVVVASFEAVAGGGSARTYTALALRTISRQFRCLRDAIAGQVRAASRALGEDADATAAGVGARTVGSRLRYIDHQLRQQRALQQLGMMQSSAWRPQRGLPERSVSILRAWLFEHFLHPYPKDSDKIMLAKQTGLTRSQVSNWFINARVRLWKPMVEEMYLEETKDKLAADPDAGAGGEGQSGSGGGRKSGIDHHHNAATTSKTAANTARMAGGVHASMLELAGDGHHAAAHAGFYGEEEEDDDGGGVGMQHGFKKARTSDEQQQQQTAAFQHVSDVQATLHAQAAAAAAAARHDEQVSHRELLMKFMESGSAAAAAREHDHAGASGYSLFAPAPYGGQFGSEQFTFAGQHGGGGGGAGGVSLTLGLPHGAGEQTASFLMSSSSNGSDGGVAGGGGGGYDMNMQSTKSFAAQLMRDFVA